MSDIAFPPAWNGKLNLMPGATDFGPIPALLTLSLTERFIGQGFAMQTDAEGLRQAIAAGHDAAVALGDAIGVITQLLASVDEDSLLRDDMIVAALTVTGLTELQREVLIATRKASQALAEGLHLPDALRRECRTDDRETQQKQ